MNRLQESIGEWGEETFKHSKEHLPAIFSHLVKEVNELETEIKSYRMTGSAHSDRLAAECADIFILMCSMAHLCGFSLDEAVRCKMAINRSRTWGEPDADGVIEHVAVNP